MSTGTEQKIIDGDGHVVEDIASILKYMPEDYIGKSFSDARGKNPFPPIDHLHSSNRHFTPKGAFANVGREGWELFLDDVGIGTTVLYTSAGLAFGKIVSRDWAIELARAYNNWLYDTYLSKSQRFKAMGLIPLQEPAEAVIELRRIVRDLGFAGAMLPSSGVNMPHLGSQKYWPIYGEAERLGCAIAIHGGSHENLLMDDMSPYVVANALGHPMSQMIGFAGIIFNGIFDKFPGLRIGFMEAGCAWLLTCIERFTGSWATHVQFDPRGRFLELKKGEKIIDYICRHIDEGRIFVGCEGEELSIVDAGRITGDKTYVFSTGHLQEGDAQTWRHGLGGVRQTPSLMDADKTSILLRSSQCFYQHSQGTA